MTRKNRYWWVTFTEHKTILKCQKVSEPEFSSVICYAIRKARGYVNAKNNIAITITIREIAGPKRYKARVCFATTRLSENEA